MWLGLTVLLVVFTVFVQTTLRTTSWISATALFAYVQMVFVVGTVPLLDPSSHVDQVYGAMLLVVVGVFLVVSMVFAPAVARSIPQTSERSEEYLPGLGVGVAIAVSLGVVALYYATVGHVALFAGIESAVEGGDADVATLRLASYSGERYFAPGYVNQFRVALLPALAAVTIVSWRRAGVPRRSLSIALAVIAVIALLGTGQRAAFIQFTLCVFVFLVLLNARKPPRGSLRFGAIFFVLLTTATLALARTARGVAPGATVFDRFLESVGGAIGRFFVDQQRSGIITFRYVYEMPVQDGREWLRSLQGLLPGSRGSSLANEIYASVYGTPRGTATPSIWASAYHNFGLAGPLVLSVVVALLLSLVSWLGLRAARTNELHSMGVAGVFVGAGMWATGTPVTPLNNGLAVFVLLWLVGSRALARNSASQAELRPDVPSRVNSDGASHVRRHKGERFPGRPRTVPYGQPRRSTGQVGR